MGFAGQVGGIRHLNEYKSSSPEWTECLEAFNRTIEKALCWKALRLVSNAYHMIAVIYDEHLNESVKALEVLDVARKHVGNNDYIIEDAISMIFFRHTKYEDALGILETILPSWKSNPNVSLLLSYRRAEISAARLGRWDKSAMLAENGANYAHKLDDKTKEIGFKADQAFALWKANDRQKSIELFSVLLHDLHLLPDPYGDLHSYALQKLIGHALTWLRHDISNAHLETHSEPQPGCFSSHEVDERIKDSPLQPIEFFWMTLAEIENELKLDDKIFKHFRDKYHKTRYLVIKTTLTKLVVLHSLRRHDLSSLIQSFHDFVVTIEAIKKIISKPHDLFKEIETCEPVNKSDEFYESLIILLCFALIDLFVRNKNITEMTSLWKSGAERLGLMDSKLSIWFSFLESSTSKCEYELTQILSSNSAGAGERTVAALLLSTNKEVPPEISFYSHLFLFYLSSSQQSIWGKEVEDQLEQIIVPMWLEIVKNKSFSLLNPRLIVPKILELSQDTSEGFIKIAKVLYAAKDVVNISIPQDMLISLKRFAQ